MNHLLASRRPEKQAFLGNSETSLAIATAAVNSGRSRAVAQLGSALEWGSRGRGFESRRPESFPVVDDFTAEIA